MVLLLILLLLLRMLQLWLLLLRLLLLLPVGNRFSHKQVSMHSAVPPPRLLP